MRLTVVGVQRSTDENVLESPTSHLPVDVLLVEDNFYDVDLTTHALKDAILPERIKAVHDGAEALDFILLDLQLPRVDGLEVLRRIRADPLTEDIPVVIFTHSKGAA